ncbi:MAG: hypothetical protein AAFX59_12490 [Pseudomonadota bacterium]
MLRTLGRMLMLCAGVGPMAAWAECSIGPFEGVAPSFSGTAPVPPAAALRPVTPECLRGLESPNQETCTDAEVAAYSASVEAYVAALNTYLAEADSYARAAADHANAAVIHAQSAQAQADAVFAYVTCEAEALRAQE